MAELDAIELRRANLITSTLSFVGEGICTVQGAKNIKPNHFNPVARILETKDAKESIPPRVARVFMRLLKEDKIPAWATQEVDLEMIKRSADG